MPKMGKNQSCGGKIDFQFNQKNSNNKNNKKSYEIFEKYKHLFGVKTMTKETSNCENDEIII